MATDASRPTVSWLKFEPKVSNFPATKTALVASAIKTNLLFFYLFFEGAITAPPASQKRISWLKFEPRVLNFPATKTAAAVLVASAIMRSSLFFVYLFCFSIYFYFYLRRLSSLCGGRCTSGRLCVEE